MEGGNYLIKCENDIIVLFDDSINFISIFMMLGKAWYSIIMVLQANTSVQVV